MRLDGSILELFNRRSGPDRLLGGRAALPKRGREGGWHEERGRTHCGRIARWPAFTAALANQCRIGRPPLLAGHQFLIEDFSTGRPFNFLERLTFSAAARDPMCADTFSAFGSRCIGVRRFLRPDALARAIWVNARHALSAAKMQPSMQ
jgi:hypothetical protein